MQKVNWRKVQMLHFLENCRGLVHDIEQEFHTAYNTVAKSVAILERNDLVREISSKQRYRVYCYEQYLKEIMK